jgi:hypothetical protein
MSETELLLVLLRRLRLHHSWYTQLSITRPRIAKVDGRQLRSPSTGFENDVTYSLTTEFFPELHDDPLIAGVSVSMASRWRSMLAASDGTRGSAVERSQGEIFPSLFFRLTRLPELSFKEKRST